MNTKIQILFAAGLGMLAASCTDLDVPVESQYTSYPSSEEAVEAKMAGIYFQMRDCFGRRYMEGMELSSDEYTALSYSGNWVDSYAYSNATYHNFNAENATIDWMNVLGEGVVKANEVIESDADAKYIAAARAIRAYFTYIEMDCFGDAPINDAAYCEENGFTLGDRQPRAEVAKWIEKELLAVYNDLPTETTGDNYGKPNKYMALGLLARLYINWAVYTASDIATFDANTATNEKLADCVSVCDQIINSGVFALGPDPYRFKFSYDNTERVEAGTIKDFIYAMPYHTTEATGMQYGRSHSYKDIKKLNPSYYGEVLTNSGGAYIAVTPECAALFCLEGDQRNTMIIQDTVYVYDPTTLLPTDQVCLDRNGNPLILNADIALLTENDRALDVGDNVDGWRQGARSMKWFVTNNDYKNGRNQSNDIPLIRYADILLIKAEALVRQGSNNSTAVSLFNQIREYVEAPTFSGTLTLDDIYEERGREFFDENLRRMDMIRFGHFEDEYFPMYKSNPNAKFDTFRRIFPLHSANQLATNPTWEQNPGY